MANLKDWIGTLRLKTLPASVMPVFIASALAYSEEKYDIIIATIILLCSIFIQLLTNFYNEIYDFQKGADTADRLGPKRAIASGTISSKSMWIVSILLSVITFILGLYLVNIGGIPILIIGIVSLLLSWAYTGGPYPLAYKGLGDLFVFIFFGLIAVNGSYYLFTGEINNVSIIASTVPGFLSMNILSVNNIRDIETDKIVGKITMAVRLGRVLSIKIYSIIIALTYSAVFFHSLLVENFNILLPFISFPLAILNLKGLQNKYGKELNPVLAKTGALLAIFGFLYIIGIII